jgi:DNA-binding NarL/FixJ family response regulator
MKKLLIVDDSAIMRKNLRSLLQAAGYDVVAEATNGEEGVRLYKEHHPDLVTMDVTMPVMGGVEAVKSIVAYDPRAIILVVSAFDQRSTLFEAMELGAKHYIIKPITREKLLGAVNKLIGEPETGAESDGNDEYVSAKASALPTSEIFLRKADQLSSEAFNGTTESNKAKSANDKPTAETANTPAPAPASATVPVQIENRSGTFYVTVTPETTTASLEAVRPALQGLLFIKPLRLAIDFGAMPSAAPELLRLAGELLEPAAQAGGDARLLARDPALLAQLQRLHPHLAAYADA